MVFVLTSKLIVVCCCCQPITDDDVDRIATCIRVLADQSSLMFHVFNDMCRQSLSVMLSVKADEEKEFQKVCDLQSYTFCATVGHLRVITEFDLHS